METRPITWSGGSSRLRTRSFTSTTTAPKVRHAPDPAVALETLASSQPRLLLSELKLPIRLAATGVGDQDEDTKPTKPDAAGPEKGPCCPCPKSVEDLEAEAADASYRKVFENFLHNSIFTPR